MRFKFETDDNLVYNQKINVPVCVISIIGILKEKNWYYPQVNLQDCFYESDYLDEFCANLIKINSFVKN